MVIFITGDQGSGKTVFLKAISTHLREEGIPCAGILKPCCATPGRDELYSILDISSGESRPFISLGSKEGWQRQHQGWVNPEGIIIGRNALSDAAENCPPAVIVDEIGAPELKGTGWSTEFLKLLDACIPVLLVSAGKAVIPKAVKKFGIENPVIWYAGAASVEAAGSWLSEFIRSTVPIL